MLPDDDGLWLPCELPLLPDWGCGVGELPVLEEDELADDPLLPDGEEVAGGVPPADPDDPELPLDGVLGTGMPLGLGCVMTVCGRQPDNSIAAPAHAAVARRSA